MINKLVVIINSLKLSKIKNILLYKIKFLLPNYGCLQNPWLGGYRPQDPCSLCPKLNLLNPHPPNKIPVYATAMWQGSNVKAGDNLAASDLQIHCHFLIPFVIKTGHMSYTLF